MHQSILGRVFAWLAAAYQRQQAIHRLSSLNDHLLRDLGIARRDIPEVVERGLPPMERPVAKSRRAVAGFRLRPGTSRRALR